MRSTAQARDFPLSSTDACGRLLVGAAMHTRDGAQENIRKLVNVGVDVIVIVSYAFYYGQMTDT